MFPMFVWQRSVLASLLVASILPENAVGQQIAVVSANPNWANSGSGQIAVTLTGNGLDAVTAVRFVTSRADSPSGIAVKQISILDSNKLVALISIADGGPDASYDVELETDRDFVTASSIFSIRNNPRPTFGCIGAEVWRLRRSCKRGTVDRQTTR